MRARYLIPVAAVALTGCVRQDTDILTRVARKLADRTQESTADLRGQLPFKIVSTNAEVPPQKQEVQEPKAELPPPEPKSEPSLVDRVRQRLTSDKQLASATIEIAVDGVNVDLKGTVADDDQKRRAVALAESTVGVEMVYDNLKVNPQE